jgi:GTPase SAR1 family protein
MDRNDPPSAFLVMYSVVDKASFQRAEDELSRLQEWDLLRTRPALLVGNKIDLARSRSVSTQGIIIEFYS